MVIFYCIKVKYVYRPAPPPMNFEELLKIAEKKQFEPIIIEKKEKEEEKRLLTKKQKMEEERQKMRKEGSLNGSIHQDGNHRIPKVTDRKNNLDKGVKSPPSINVKSEKSNLKIRKDNHSCGKTGDKDKSHCDDVRNLGRGLYNDQKGTSRESLQNIQTKSLSNIQNRSSNGENRTSSGQSRSLNDQRKSFGNEQRNRSDQSRTILNDQNKSFSSVQSKLNGQNKSIGQSKLIGHSKLNGQGKLNGQSKSAANENRERPQDNHFGKKSHEQRRPDVEGRRSEGYPKMQDSKFSKPGNQPHKSLDKNVSSSSKLQNALTSKVSFKSQHDKKWDQNLLGTKQYVPKDVKPKQFPPPDVRRSVVADKKKTLLKKSTIRFSYFFYISFI